LLALQVRLKNDILVIEMPIIEARLRNNYAKITMPGLLKRFKDEQAAAENALENEIKKLKGGDTVSADKTAEVVIETKRRCVKRYYNCFMVGCAYALTWFMCSLGLLLSTTMTTTITTEWY
jgi:hypothetical protein